MGSEDPLTRKTRSHKRDKKKGRKQSSPAGDGFLRKLVVYIIFNLHVRENERLKQETEKLYKQV